MGNFVDLNKLTSPLLEHNTQGHQIDLKNRKKKKVKKQNNDNDDDGS